MNTITTPAPGAPARLDTLTTPVQSASVADVRSWYEAMASAWGNVLDQQAQTVTNLSSEVAVGGKDNPATMTLLSAESMRMQFLSQNASTSMSSVGQALETLARK